MPQYHQAPDDWRGHGKITITYSPWWREIPLVKKWIPYRVGDRVRFHVHLEKYTPHPYAVQNSVIYERFGGTDNHTFPLDGIDTSIVGSIISREGDVEYCLGSSHRRTTTYTIFTAKALSPDTNIDKWFWLIAGAILALFFQRIYPWLREFVGTR